MFKYRISASQESTRVMMRIDAKVKAVGVQEFREISLWAEVPYDVGGEQLEPRTFLVVPTGGDVPDAGTYLGTVLDARLVWHIYEVP